MPSIVARFQDPFLQGRVKDVTLNRYKKSLAVFTAWATDNQMAPTNAEEWDDALWEYQLSDPKLTKS